LPYPAGALTNVSGSSTPNRSSNRRRISGPAGVVADERERERMSRCMLSCCATTTPGLIESVNG
jgi:hypothetical protein